MSGNWSELIRLDELEDQNELEDRLGYRGDAAAVAAVERQRAQSAADAADLASLDSFLENQDAEADLRARFAAAQPGEADLRARFAALGRVDRGSDSAWAREKRARFRGPVPARREERHPEDYFDQNGNAAEPVSEISWNETNDELQDCRRIFGDDPREGTYTAAAVNIFRNNAIAAGRRRTAGRRRVKLLTDVERGNMRNLAQKCDRVRLLPGHIGGRRRTKKRRRRRRRKTRRRRRRRKTRRRRRRRRRKNRA